MKTHQRINMTEEIEAFSDSQLLADQLVRIADEIGDAQTSYWLKESAAHINGMWRFIKAVENRDIKMSSTTDQLSENQRKILAHTVHGSLVCSRNWYAALPVNKKDWDDLKQLVAKGLMFEGDKYLIDGLYFHCTQQGIEAANSFHKEATDVRQPVFSMIESKMRFKNSIDNGILLSFEILKDGFDSVEEGIKALEKIGLSVHDITKTDHKSAVHYQEGRVFIVKLKT